MINKKNIKVAAAIIRAEDKILATCRAKGEYAGAWEFPGGKVEPGETSEEAVIREIKEELDVSIQVGELVHTIEYDYPTFHLSMDCYFATVIEGDITLLEHSDAKWLTKGTLDSVDWLEADLELIDILKLKM